jgi:hypothetical protein
MSDLKCDACETASDWVHRRCHHSVVLQAGTYEQQRDKAIRERDAARAEVERLRAADIHSCGPTCSREACALTRERDEARGDAERIRQKAIVAQSERDHARVEFKMLQYRLDAAREIISKNGCDCDCDHDAEGHDADCDRCLACRISDALWPKVSK